MDMGPPEGRSDQRSTGSGAIQTFGLFKQKHMPFVVCVLKIC